MQPLKIYGKTNTVVAEEVSLMKNESIINLLRPFDLNSYEAKSYLALLQKENLAVTDVAKISGVPRGRVYEVLKGLHEKGLCNLLPGNAKKYRAVNPEVLKKQIKQKIIDNEKEIENKKQKYISELERRKKEFEMEIEKKKRVFETQIDRKRLELIKLKESTNKTVETLNEVYKEGREDNNPLEYIEIMKDSNQAQRRFIELSENCNKEILVFSKKGLEGTYNRREENMERRLKAFDKGIRVKCIYDLWIDESVNKLMFDEIDVFIKAGEEARIYHNDLPLQMAIFDSKIVMFRLIDPSTGIRTSTSQIIEHPAMARGLIMLFESIWTQSEDYKSFISKYRENESNKTL
jgi:sugar-specific transcriptional regulator TrmB